MNFLKKIFLFFKFISKLKVEQKGGLTVLEYNNLQVLLQDTEVQLRFKGFLLLDPMFYSLCAEDSVSNSILREDTRKIVELYREIVNLDGQERDKAYQQICDCSNPRYNSIIEKSGSRERFDAERVS